MAKRTTAVVCGRVCVAPLGDFFVTCSFDSNHVVLRSRMPYHIIKCEKNHRGHNKLQCPYDSCEYIDPIHFPNHLLTCESKKSLCAEKYKTAELRASGNICNIKQTPFFHAGLPEPDEDWGGPRVNEENDEEEVEECEVKGVGRGISLKREHPQKGVGRAEMLQRILNQYRDKQSLTSSDSSGSSDKENVVRKFVKSGQFEDA